MLYFYNASSVGADASLQTKHNNPIIFILFIGWSEELEH